ncbi:unnamed protein product [Soboliphyme baturini]|uniref:Uncharacterized protein n=1 Tax=Soboliphyme baturini TaxID=241478 RepID=A0A183IQ54_9BILA|nr:unnamed protein product [Soboliphyme baturini]
MLPVNTAVVGRSLGGNRQAITQHDRPTDRATTKTEDVALQNATGTQMKTLQTGIPIRAISEFSRKRLRSVGCFK